MARWVSASSTSSNTGSTAYASIPAAVPVNRPVSEQDFHSEFSQQGFEAAVEKARQYIIDGDAMQIVLSQRLSIPYKSPPIDLIPGIARPESVALHVLPEPG